MSPKSKDKLFKLINFSIATKFFLGEYDVQTGFGWTNGVIIDFMVIFGDDLLSDEEDVELMEGKYIIWQSHKLALKFIYSEKATKFCKIFTLLLTGTTILLTSSNNQISEFRIPNIYNEIFVLIFLMILRTHFEASLRFRKN